jgi:integrase
MSDNSTHSTPSSCHKDDKAAIKVYSSLMRALPIEHIVHYTQQNHAFTPPEDAIKWVLHHWPNTQESSRQVAKVTLRDVRQQWTHRPARLKSHYQSALTAILLYLHHALGWEIPKTEEKKLVDHDAKLFENITSHAHAAYRLLQGYSTFLETFYQKRAPLSQEQVALIVALEVAPLPLDYLHDILTSPECIEIVDNHLYLRLRHIQGHQSQGRSDKEAESASFTRYHLPLSVYRALTTFYEQKATRLSHASMGLNPFIERLQALIGQLLGDAEPSSMVGSSTPPRPKRQLHFLFQAAWYYRDDVVPTLLKDIAYPTRHVAYDLQSPNIPNQQKQLDDIYTQTWDDKWYEKVEPGQKEKWPHQALLNAYKKNRTKPTEYEVTRWQRHNVLPQLAGLFVRNLILFGGERVENLSDSTLTQYSGLTKILKPFPLSFEASQSHDELMAWAHRTYAALTTHSSQQKLHRFFKFLTTQDLTDHINLNELHNPTVPINVDANFISLDALHEIVHALVSNTKGHFYQRLFSASAVILAYFGKLRRGEIVRLRIKDIWATQKTASHHGQDDNQCFTLHVTQTREGKTKNRQSRWVHIYLPPEFATLIRMCIKLKPRLSARAGLVSRSPQMPLIGFENESTTSRQLHYLLPATKAIKAICGEDVRFHHLRHSGACVSLLQSLHFISHDTDTDMGLPPKLQALMTQEVLKAQFQHWLEQQDTLNLNDNLVFEEFIREIGHKHYATTRKHYIHGMDWLYPFYRKAGNPKENKPYTRAELCWLLGLKKGSNDLSRRIAKLDAQYAQLSTEEKKHYPLLFSEEALRHHLFSQKPKAPSNTIPTSHLTTLLTELSDEALRANQPDCRPFPNVQRSLLKTLFCQQFNHNKDQFLFSDISAVWAYSNKHRPEMSRQKWEKAMGKVNSMTLIDGDETPQILIKMSTNQKDGTLFREAFKVPELQFFQASFNLMVNGKTDPTRQEKNIREHFADEKDSVLITKKREGSTELHITLSLRESITLAPQTMHYIYEYLTYFQTHNKYPEQHRKAKRRSISMTTSSADKGN